MGRFILNDPWIKKAKILNTLLQKKHQPGHCHVVRVTQTRRLSKRWSDAFELNWSESEREEVKKGRCREKEYIKIGSFVDYNTANDNMLTYRG